MVEKKKYDLETRTLEYGRRVIRMCKSLPFNQVNNVLVNQVMRSGTSFGANYREANETETKKDFQFRIRICRKEAKETIYWLQLIIEANPTMERKMGLLLSEASEYVKIFAAIIVNSK